MAHEWNVSKRKGSSLKKVIETAVIIGVATQNQTEAKAQEYLDELEFLAETAGAVTKKRFLQNLQVSNNRTYVGSGKIEEIKGYIDTHNINIAIFDDDLSGKQVSILEEYLEIKIVDRSTLILDIFASRAQTAQAKTQVELAQLQYMLPRLKGLWDHLERQKGGIGMRGPGEKEIETDRRIVRDSIDKLKKKLIKIDTQNQTQRKNRGDFIRVSLVGYTNVGKSTIMNKLGKADVFAENKLFATLDTTVRKLVIENTPFLLSDTVGFIRKLPHHLVESFKSTLDEVRESDILLHVVDIAHPQYEDHIETVNKTLKSLEMEEKPTVMVFNKMDMYRDQHFDDLVEDEIKEDIEKELKENHFNNYQCPNIYISAINKENFDEFRAMLLKLIQEQYTIRYPYKTNYFY